MECESGRRVVSGEGGSGAWESVVLAALSGHAAGLREKAQGEQGIRRANRSARAEN